MDGSSPTGLIVDRFPTDLTAECRSRKRSAGSEWALADVVAFPDQECSDLSVFAAMIQTFGLTTHRETFEPAGIRPLGRAELKKWVADDVATFEPLTHQLWHWSGGPLIGRRLVWSVEDPVASRRVAILSSRLPRGIAKYPGWRLAFRTAMFHALSLRLSAVTCAGTTCDGWVTSAFASRGLRVVHIRRSRQTAVASWLRRDVLSTVRSCGEQNSSRAMLISPPLDGLPVDTLPFPNGDCLLTGLADDVFVLHARVGGGVTCLLNSAFRSGMLRTKRVYLARGLDRVPDALVQCWRRHGGIDWQVLSPCTSLLPLEQLQPVESTVAPILFQPPSHRTYLAHWTRASVGPWPDESSAEYVEAMLSNVSDCVERTNLTTLKRILHMQKLVATSRLTRGTTRVVCLTSRGVETFPHLRCYRRHQRRWDFECYGLAITLDWMISRGARPVIYGDNQVWASLRPDQRPFFQLAMGRGNGTDWRREAEWRIVGDVCLRTLKMHDAFTFVPNLAAGIHVADKSPWPVVVLPSETV